MSISAVAKRAGVSRTTVSLVINNRPSIPPATARAVRQAMADIGYVPVAPERRPGRKASPVKVGAARLALIARMPGAYLRSPVYANVLQGVESAAREVKSSVLLHQVPDIEDWDPQALVGSVDALVLFGGQRTPLELGPLATLPCVQVMGHPAPIGWCDHVTYKNESIGFLAADYLLQGGHRHTASIFQANTGHWTRRHSAFTAMMQEAGGTVLALDGAASVQVQENEQTTDRVLLGRLVDEVLKATPRPTALFLSSDLLASPIYWLLLERGVQPGQDIQIVSCNNERPLLNGLHPRPAVIDTHSEMVGRQAVERLLWRMKHPTAPIADILIQPTLVGPSP